MNKLIKLTLLAILTASVSAFAAGTISVGYREKGIDFGKVSDPEGAVVTAVNMSWKSFSFGASAENRVTLSSAQFSEATFSGGYRFFSTLADVEVGAQYAMKNHPGKFDLNGHFRPFVSVGKGPASVAARYDAESRLINIEGALTGKHALSKNVSLKTAIFGGYTDANDAMPKTLKEIKYTNAYYGGSIDASWKMFSVGMIALQDGNLNKHTLGWRTSTSLSF
jgi:hypothetical protein